MQIYIRMTICHNFYWTWGNVLCKVGHGARRAKQTQVSISFTACQLKIWIIFNHNVASAIPLYLHDHNKLVTNLKLTSSILVPLSFLLKRVEAK